MTTRRTALALLFAALFLPAAGRAAATADFSDYVTVGGRVLFFGFLPEGDGTTQCGLWTVDPVSGAAERLADVCPGAGVPSTIPLHWLATGSAIGYFSNPKGKLGAPTAPLRAPSRWAPSRSAATPTIFPPWGATGGLCFQGCIVGQGCEPWRSDGSLAGTYQLRELAPGSASSYPSGFLRDGRRVVFGVIGALGRPTAPARGLCG